jgi:hypothetical protein
VQSILSPFPKALAPLVTKHLKPCSVLFTYRELGFDLTGKSSASRSKALREVIASLAWPKGTIGYWPIAIPEGDELHIDLANFWLAARLMQAKHIVCFGASSYDLLTRRNDMQYGSSLVLDSACHLLPDLESLAESAPATLAEALSTLKTLNF